MDTILKASVNDVRYFVALLRGVNFVNRATITVQASGIKVIVEEARTLLGTAFIFSDIFDEYEFNLPSVDPEVHQTNEQPAEQPSEEQEPQEDGETGETTSAFEIPLSTLIECLNIFGSAGTSGVNTSAKGKRWRNDDDPFVDEEDGRRRGRNLDSFFGGPDKRTGMRMSFAGPGSPLTLLLAEDAAGPTTTCEIETFDSEPVLELPFDAEHMVLKIILKSSWLREALSELDPSCKKLTFIGNPTPAGNPGKQKTKASSVPIFRIQAVGTFGSTEMDYPNDKEVLESFECAQPLRFSYRFGHISRTLRALQSSTKTSLRIDEDGLLSLQFMMAAPSTRRDSSAAFIEFRCLALDEDS